MKLNLLAHLSQDYFPVCIAELETLLGLFFKRFIITELKKPLIKVSIENVNIDKVLTSLSRILYRSACIKRMLILFESEIDLESIPSINLPRFILTRELSTFAGHIHDYDGDLGRDLSRSIIDRIYELMYEKYSFKLNLSNPEIIVAVYKVGNKYYLGLEFHHDRKGFEYRRPHRRPVFTPFSLEPKLSRLLINLSGVPDDGIILDPFCGVAGIPIEAASIGISSLCIELKYRWTRGAYVNLKWFPSNIYWDVICGDSLSDFISSLHEIFIATDPPYGRITPTSSDVNQIYQEFIDKFVSRAKGSAFFSPMSLTNILKDYNLLVKYVFPIKVHKNLVRYLYVIR